jgi:hypothetical protein
MSDHSISGCSIVSNQRMITVANEVARIVFVLMMRGGQYEGRPVVA